MIATAIGISAAVAVGFFAGSYCEARSWKVYHAEKVARMGDACRKVIDDMDGKQKARIAKLKEQLFAIARMAGVPFPDDEMEGQT